MGQPGLIPELLELGRRYTRLASDLGQQPMPSSKELRRAWNEVLDLSNRGETLARELRRKMTAEQVAEVAPRERALSAEK